VVAVVVQKELENEPSTSKDHAARPLPHHYVPPPPARGSRLFTAETFESFSTQSITKETASAPGSMVGSPPTTAGGVKVALSGSHLVSLSPTPQRSFNRADSLRERFNRAEFLSQQVQQDEAMRVAKSGSEVIEAIKKNKTFSRENSESAPTMVGLPTMQQAMQVPPPISADNVRISSSPGSSMSDLRQHNVYLESIKESDQRLASKSSKELDARKASVS
jgi:hypothetical protein